MRTASLRYGFLLVGMIGLFIAGVVHVFLWKFEAGDVYPEYSSLRKDPLGSSLWYESLERIPYVRVARGYERLEFCSFEETGTYLILGMEPTELRVFPKFSANRIEQMLEQGWRIVMTFHPQGFNGGDPEEKDDSQKQQVGPKKGGAEKKGKKEAQKDKKSPPPSYVVSLAKTWGFKVKTMKERKNLETLSIGKNKVFQAILDKVGAMPWQPKVPWMSFNYLEPKDESWKTVARVGDYPVVIEKKIGKGSVVLASDSYFASNEALAEKDRHTEFLLWLMGGSRFVLFDEVHHGIERTMGVSGLIRKFRMEGFFVGVLWVLVLYVWKNSFGYLSPTVERSGIEEIRGKRSLTGFRNLLRRSINRGRLMEVCLGEWEKSKHLTSKEWKLSALLSKDKEIKEAASGKTKREGSQGIVEHYRAFCRVLGEEK